MSERDYWLGWSVFPGVGPGKFKFLLDHFRTAKEAWETDQLDLKSVIGEKLSLDFEEFRKIFSIENYLEKLEKKNVWFLIQKDPQYPQLLLQIDKPPIILFGKGEISSIDDKSSSTRGPVIGLPPASTRLSLAASRCERLRAVGSPSTNATPPLSKSCANFDMKTIAIVGTRKITNYGREVTEILARELVRAGFTIVSGLALGVDAVAHKIAIENEGKTIAVLGCGVDLCYPSSNKKLYDEIINGNGAVISEFPIGMTPSVGSFPSRNRIIAGLSKGVVVTEGAQDSGSLITADCAIKYQRKVFAVPGPITSTLSRGPHKLLEKGAKLVVSSDDILKELVDCMSLMRGMGDMSFMGRNRKSIKGDTEEENKILELLRNEGLHFDEILRKVNMDSSKVGSLLTMMEIKGMIKSLESGVFILVK